VSEDDDIVEEPREEIARLEARIEELADDVERCRKIALVSRIVLIAGLLWLTAEVLGITRSGAPGLIGSIAAILAGLVLSGSNRSTMLQAQAALDAAEARRTELIGAIELRTVDGRIGVGSPDPMRWLH
jgi:hypothetical protein